MLLPANIQILNHVAHWKANLMLYVDYILVKNKQLISKSQKKVSSRE